MGKEVVSIVIPVYKTEKYLKDCLNSILHQSFKDWECILVDDGSPDGCAEICDCYKALDNRFVVIHKKNEGVTAARRDGVNKSIGKWILFVDSDILPQRAIQYLYEKAIEDDYDVTLGAWEKSVNGRKRIIPLMTNGELSGLELCGRLLEGRCYGGPVGKLFKKSLFTEDTFGTPTSIRLNEDLIMNLIIASRVKKAYALPLKIVYTYNANDGSASKNVLNNNWEKTFLLVKEHTPKSLMDSYYFYICQMYLKYKSLPMTTSYNELSEARMYNIFSFKTMVYQKALLNKTFCWNVCAKAYTLLNRIEKVPAFLYYILINHKAK